MSGEPLNFSGFGDNLPQIRGRLDDDAQQLDESIERTYHLSQEMIKDVNQQGNLRNQKLHAEGFSIITSLINRGRSVTKAALLTPAANMIKVYKSSYLRDVITSMATQRGLSNIQIHGAVEDVCKKMYDDVRFLLTDLLDLGEKCTLTTYAARMESIIKQCCNRFLKTLKRSKKTIEHTIYIFPDSSVMCLLDEHHDYNDDGEGDHLKRVITVTGRYVDHVIVFKLYRSHLTPSSLKRCGTTKNTPRSNKSYDIYVASADVEEVDKLIFRLDCPDILHLAPEDFEKVLSNDTDQLREVAETIIENI